MDYKKRLGEIEERMNVIKAELENDDADIDALENEVHSLTEERTNIQNEIEKRKKKADEIARGIIGKPSPETPPESVAEKRAREFAQNGRMSIETRQLLSTGTLRPDGYSTEIGELPTVVSSIVDDVFAFDATGTGAWNFAYRKTDGAAEAVTEGSAIAGTSGTFGDGTINPATWGILDEISNQVKKFTPLAYAQSVQSNAFLALRKFAKTKIVTTVLADTTMTEAKAYTLDANFLRNLVLGFNADESVAGGTKLYLCKEDLAKLGAVRGTNEKRALYDISFTDENNGTITEGGLSVRFSICSDLHASGAEGSQKVKANQMIYGQPQAIAMPMWGSYEVSTDEGGDYFKRNMMGIRGLQTAGIGITKLKAIQIIN